MTNPFAVLGIEPRVEVEREELDSRYRALSRTHHPDFNPGSDAAEQVAVLQRSAEVNDAYRALRDPWRRAAALIDLHDPAALEATKSLCPMFLMEAMEIREAAEQRPPGELGELAGRIAAKVAAYFRDISSHIDAGEIREAATLLHQSNYYRKALTDLRERMDNEA